MAPVLATLDCLHAYVDPAVAPEDFLEWLASWVGATHRRGLAGGAEAGGRGHRRRLHRRRGTVAGLREELELYTGGRWRSSRVEASRYPPPPWLHCRARRPPSCDTKITMDDLAIVARACAINAIVAASKPAHVEHVVELVSRTEAASTKETGG